MALYYTYYLGIVNFVSYGYNKETKSAASDDIMESN